MLLGVAALLGLPVLARARPGATIYLVGMLAAVLLVPSFLLQGKFSERYGLPALPLLALVAAAGVHQTLQLGSRWASQRRRLGAAVPVGVLLLIFGTALADDVEAAVHQAQEPAGEQTWLQVLEQQGIRPGDLLLSDAPTVVHFYLGRDEYFLYSDDFERYTYRTSDGLRSIYTDSLLLRTRRDFARYVERRQAGRTLWVVGRRHQLERWSKMSDPGWLPSLTESADTLIDTPDGWLLMRVPVER
jgi:hypothetical protein